MQFDVHRVAAAVTIGAFLQRSRSRPTPDLPEFDRQRVFFRAPTEGRVAMRAKR